MLWCCLFALLRSCRVEVRTCLRLHEQTRRESRRSTRRAQFETWISPPPSGHNNSTAKGTKHAKRWRGKLFLALLMSLHIRAPRRQRLEKVTLGRYVGHLGTWVAPQGGLTKGLLLTHQRPYCTCPHKAARPIEGGRGRREQYATAGSAEREETHFRPKSHIPLLWADDTWVRVPSHILINLRILGPRGPEPGQRPCPAGTPTWVGFQ